MRWFSNERGESVWKMYFSFHGRIDRLTLWLRIILLNVFTYIVLVTMNSLSTEYTGINYGSWLNCVLVVYWWSLTTLWVRRVHDRGHSGWWYGAFAIMVPLVFALNVWANFHMDLADPMQSVLTTAGLGLIGVTALAGLYLLIRFGFTLSEAGDNAYGPNPAAPRVHHGPAGPHKGPMKKRPVRRAKRVKRPAGEAPHREAAHKAEKPDAPAEEKKEEP